MFAGPCGEQIISQRQFIMARTLEAVSGSTESGSASEQCVGEHNPQPYRVGFEQAANPPEQYLINRAVRVAVCGPWQTIGAFLLPKRNLERDATSSNDFEMKLARP